MSKKYSKYFNTRATPQNKPISDMVKNSAGGFAFSVDDWVMLDRFLILGCEGGSYYASAQKLTVQNAKAVVRCIEKDGVRVINRLVEISQASVGWVNCRVGRATAKPTFFTKWAGPVPVPLPTLRSLSGFFRQSRLF